MFFYLLQIMLHQSVVTVYGLYLYCARTISNYCVKFNCMRESHKYYRQQPRGGQQVQHKSENLKDSPLAARLGLGFTSLVAALEPLKAPLAAQECMEMLEHRAEALFYLYRLLARAASCPQGHSKEATARKPGTEVEAQGHDQLTLRLSKGSRCQGLCK